MLTEATVIGAGPAGLMAAEVISKHGYSVEVFEEHDRVGYPAHCAGMVSVEGLEKIGVEPRPEFHQNTIYGGKVFSSDGSCITIRDQRPRAYIIDRARFDMHLAEKAIDSGVKINTGTHVEKILLQQGRATGLELEGSMVDSRLIVDAEGAGGRLLARSGMETGQEGVINGFNVELEAEGVETDMVEVWFNQEVSKDFFAWVIPIDENRVRCGLGTSKQDGINALRSFIKKRFNKEAPATINAGQICIGGPVKKTTYPSMILVGDVAGQVKPTTGGGIVMSCLCAKLAGEICAKSLAGDEVSLGDYERLWRGKYGSELRTMLYLRRLFNGLSDAQINRIFHVFIDEGLEEKFTAMVSEGDMDMQESIIKRAVTDPVILGAMARSIGRIAVSELFSVFGF